MLIRLFLSIPFSLVLLNSKSCNSNAASEIPKCMQQLITEYQNRPLQNPSAEFYEYEYKGQKVYYMKPPCCDQMSKLYDANCNVMCSPDGGIIGKGDGKCPDFFTERKNEKLIWKDPRQQ